MNTLFSRIKNTISADLHDLLDQKEQKNPMAMLNQHVRQSEVEVDKVRRLLERQFTLKDEFSREYKEATELAAKRKHQADISSKAGEDELYKFAIQEQQQYEERALRLKESLNHCIQQLHDLEQKYEEMKHKLKEMHLKRMELMGRENVARAHYRMNQVTDSPSFSGKTFTAFQEMEGYLDRLEQKVNSAYYRNTIDARIAQLEREIKAKKSETVS